MINTLRRMTLKALGRAYPFYSGCGTITNSRPFIKATESIDSPVPTTLRDGTRMLVDPHEFLGRSIYFSGEWDPKITWALRRLLQPGETVIDIGAHCGATALIAARLVGPQGAVHAFEPQPVLAQMLRDSAKMNGFEQLHVHELALSDSDGKAELFIPNDKLILASLNPVSGATSLAVEKRRAGDFLEDLNLGEIALIKIDVEGHELDVFRGAAEFLEHNRPRAILFESVEKEGPFRQRPPVRLLSDLDYVFYALPKRMLSMKTIFVADMEPAGCHDFIAIQRSDVQTRELLIRKR